MDGRGGRTMGKIRAKSYRALLLSCVIGVRWRKKMKGGGTLVRIGRPGPSRIERCACLGVL